MTQPNDRILSMAEAAAKVGLSPGTVKTLIKKGEFVPKIKLSARRRGFSENQINKWIAERIGGGSK